MRSAWFPSALVAAVLVASPGCSDQGADQGGLTSPSTRPLPIDPEGFEPAVPVDDSPFCRTLLALDDDEEPPSLDELAAAYLDLLDEVPAEIRAQFEIVLAELVRASSGEDDGGDPGVALAAEALAEFVESRCRGTDQNPLPPPTVPN